MSHLQRRRVLLSVMAMRLSKSLCAQSDLQFKDRGNRLEGLITIPRGKKPIEILSFLASVEDSPTELSTKLRVRFFAASKTPLYVRARHLLDQPQYRMQSKLIHPAAQAWNDFGPWPTGDVLQPSKITLRDLGILVAGESETVSEAALPYCLPAFVYHTQTPRLPTHYTIVLLTANPQKEIRCAVSRIARIEPLWSETRGRSSAGERVIFSIPTAPLEEGPLQVRIEGKNLNRLDGPLESFQFQHRR